MSNWYRLMFALVLVPFLVLGAGFGSKSLLHVQTASTLKAQRLDAGTNLRFFTKAGEFLGGSKPANFTQANYWDVQNNIVLSYGIAEHFDVSAQLRLYQDVHRDGAQFFNPAEYNIPDDLFLQFKAGSFAVASDKVHLGALAEFRLPTGDVHNYPFEPYTAGGFEFGFGGLFSYYNDPFINERDFSFHASVEYYFYNDAGKELYDSRVIGTIEQDGNSTSLNYGVGFSYPTEMFDLNLELFGLTFMSEPDSFAFSREDFMYVTPSIRYKPNWRFNFDLGMDIRLSSDEDTSDPRASFSGQNLDIPNYVSWRMTLGVGVVLTRGTDSFKGVDSKADVKEKVDFYQRLLKEREKTRSIEEELRRLKREREQAEKELEELRQLLEEEN